ncbi:protein FAM53A [Ailuropoda melanoleuca]|uniref:Stem-loop histone mRNA binding protein n=1 Tax=Ailuropoda melanoleuca TaxID=9646 RepID=A0A7N5KEI6_AILME|nr:protein FAM53A [Ailuropoda melanoleuca]XP_034528122.1 protein FAM53A [Ailuropoda melanoleuca]XP_034528123.1 protein FAM53A [Ailuropoda melanoleuca]XP_034528124.1 protein FAM53A [Ailuropoda melanoleuca]XP_034528125.1 protein FAM53A [Ailuropoda melanoleuca]XP_034528126.1 protein FAM53A [Ailuropoda melanoleuca]XP_034528127.1 protein FAM53A [Ailuropoda melanoleuca]XP_034528128.1 protein FAM53A [Ailuropoda melanoleuca]
MVTLITEKLQSQSLDDLACKSCDAGLRSAGTLSNSGHFSPFESNEDRRPWKVLSGGWPVGSQTATGTRGPDTGLGAVSATDLRESAGPPSAPPTKRHCRSLSEPDGLARCRSPWRPGGSKVWTPVSKRRCHSGGSATLQESPGASLPRSATLLGCALPVAGPTSPPTPRAPSASGSCGDGREGGSGPPWRPAGPRALSWRRRLSLSQEHLAEVGTPLPSASSSPWSTPELGRRLGLLRCRSQPCVLVGRKWPRRRRREESARWPRPSLDFLKMTRTLKNSKSLCSLDDEDEEEDGAQVELALCDSRGRMGVLTAGSSPLSVRPRPCCAVPGPWASWEPLAAESEGGSGEDPSDGDGAGEEGAFPPGRGELDLGQIESN